MKENKVVTLAEYIINVTNTEAYRAGKLSGRKHMDVTSEVIDSVGGRNNLLKQAKFLENCTDAWKKGKIEIGWCQIKTDINKIHYDICIIPELCKLIKIEDPREHQIRLISNIERRKMEVKEYNWICKYYNNILERLALGKTIQDAEDDLRFHCINEIAKIKEPVWERVFSARVFGDSKVFEKCYREKMITILTNNSPYYEENMENYEIEDNDSKDKSKIGREILKMHGILSYAQTLEWKGPLQYRLDNGKIIATTDYIYGFVINTQTLEHSQPIIISECKKIMTIENKANYESMTYSKDTLYIFCHGYLTPKEVCFLKQLHKIVSEECEFYHWGDLDFGGISIFQYIKDKIFPDLKPYRMGVKDYEDALKIGAGIPLKTSTRKKLEKKEAGLLTDLKEAILHADMTIEQEKLL